jgi:hypothetical protein
MITKKIFLASSAELKEDRNAFEILIGRKNKDWKDRGVFLELIVWEDFLDAMSPTRLQDEYDKYTEEEFETAFGQFKTSGRPFVFTYFKDAPISTGSASLKDLASLLAFKEKLAALGHFQTTYENVEGLQLHFHRQLDKLVASGFIEFEPQGKDAGEPAAAGDTYYAKLEGSGAIAQGRGAMAAGAGGVVIGGANTGNINNPVPSRSAPSRKPKRN